MSRLLAVAAWLALLSLVASVPVLAGAIATPPSDALRSPSAAASVPLGDVPQSASLAHLPLRFIANRGQWDEVVQFAVRGDNHALYFTPQQVIFRVNAGHAGDVAQVRLTFPGAQRQPRVEGVSPLPGSVNFFIGNDPQQWRVNVPAYAAITYRQLYPGVDLVYSGVHGRLKSEFRLAPGVHPRVIALAYAGVASAQVLPDGALRLRTAHGELVEAPPLAYQEIDGKRQIVAARYVLRYAPCTPLPALCLPVLVQFEVSGYDPRWPLVIDPTLQYASFLGGNQDESGNGIAVDDAGNVYVAGYTTSDDFPTNLALQPQRRGGSDVFVTQLVRVDDVYTYGFSTYLGGSGSDTAHNIAVNGSGDAVTVVGETFSSNFPIFNAPQATIGTSPDAFVTRLISQSGVITFAYSTYLGGSSVDRAYGVALDSAGEAVVVGETMSNNLYTTTTAIQPACGKSSGLCYFDGFVARITNSGGYTFSYASYLGGKGGDRARAVAVDPTSDSMFVTGQTGSPDFPIFNAPQPVWGVAALHLPTAELEATAAVTYPDGFVCQITTSGSYTYAYSTYLGGAFADGGRAIAVDSSGNAWVTGHTGSMDFPRTPDAVQPTYGGGTPIGEGGDAFLTHIVDAGGVYTFGYSTFVGGRSDEVGHGLVLASNDNPIVAGHTLSNNFPTHSPLQSDRRGASDAFVTRLISTTGAYTFGFSTYLGGSSTDVAYAVDVDTTGNIYVTGRTLSNDFPTLNALDASRSGATDAFVARLGWGGLMISKSATPTVVAPGGLVSFTLAYTNDSPTLAQNVVISDYLPIPITFTQASYVSHGATVTPTGSFSYTWQVDDLAPGAGGTIEVLAVLSNTLPFGTLITNTATITGDGAYPNTTYLTATVVITVGQGFPVYLPVISREEPAT